MAQKVAAAAAANVGGTTAMGTEENNGTRMPSILELLAMTNTSSRLGEDAVKYIEAIDKEIADAKLPIVNYPVSTDTIEARVYVDTANKAAILLSFAESYNQTTLDNVPPADRARDIIETFHVHHADITNILEHVVVSKHDYTKAGVMASFIMNAFATFAGKTSKLSIQNLNQQKLSVITNIDEVRNFVRTNSPHSIPARDDIGCLICVDVPTKNNNQYGQQEFVQKPFMAITGYTRFMTPEESGINKFVPIVLITDIVSSIPNKALLSLALPIAADAMIMQGLWARPYSTFAKDKPNIGSLYSDSKTGKPYFIPSVEEFHAFVRDRLTNPFLGLDISEGRARMVGIDQFVYDRTSAVADIQNFLGCQFNLETDPSICTMRSYTGTMSVNGVMKDTRVIDYLALAPAVPDCRHVQHFLRQPMQPGKRIEDIRKIYPEGVENLYDTTTLVLSSAIINQMAQAINAAIRLTYDTPTSADYNINVLLTSNGNSFDTSFNRGFRPNVTYVGNGNPYVR